MNKRPIKQNHVKPKTVDFSLNVDDLECAILGEAGWHTRAISRETGLSESQVGYRLGRAGVKRANYRNGQSDIAHFVLKQVRARDNAFKQHKIMSRLPPTIDRLQEKYVNSLKKQRSKVKR